MRKTRLQETAGSESAPCYASANFRVFLGCPDFTQLSNLAQETQVQDVPLEAALPDER
jgi:hypothetical protein